ncbi:MAG: thioredoxin fold domain-containing protein [Crocinitomicaceae bacterium]
MKKKTGIIAWFAVMAFAITSFTFEVNKVQDEKETALEWHTDLNKVHELSEKTGKPIFGFFTGSDWCGWCHKLQREVFAKDDFIEWAKKEVILLELDFPRKKKLPADLAKQNNELQQALKVTGYPTIWVFYTEKNEETGQFNLNALGRLGYPRGAVKGKEEVKFIEDANQVLAKGNKASN